MKKKYFMVFLFLLVVNSFLAYAVEETADKPDTQVKPQTQLKQDEYTWDFGQIDEGDIISHNFILKNESKSKINIINVQSSCGCTVAEIHKKTLLPGKSTTLKVKFNSRGFLGAVEKTIGVSTDNPDNPDLKFTIKGQVAIPKIDPYSWDFGKVKEGRMVEHKFMLKNNSFNTLKIQGINVSCGCITAKAAKMTLLSGERAAIRVSFNSQGYAGKVQQFVYVNTDRPDDPLIRLTIAADVIK